mmetsp:Transcript_27783/g.62244  ORF Transcript_27783/g.62244 Transcript_27783/m.62244 type:complete len:224 (-) Transcript_27783:322-993(-)
MHQCVQALVSALLHRLEELADVHRPHLSVRLHQICAAHQQSGGDFVDDVVYHGGVLVHLRDDAAEPLQGQVEVLDVGRDALGGPVERVEAPLNSGVQLVDLGLQQLALHGGQRGQQPVVLVQLLVQGSDDVLVLLLLQGDVERLLGDAEAQLVQVAGLLDDHLHLVREGDAVGGRGQDEAGAVLGSLGGRGVGRYGAQHRQTQLLHHHAGHGALPLRVQVGHV